jgi:hypothetical protein
MGPYFLVVEYVAWSNDIKDEQLKKLVRRSPKRQNCCRILYFEFATRRGADNAMRRIRASRKRVTCYVTLGVYPLAESRV